MMSLVNNIAGYWLENLDRVISQNQKSKSRNERAEVWWVHRGSLSEWICIWERGQRMKGKHPEMLMWNEGIMLAKWESLFLRRNKKKVHGQNFVSLVKRESFFTVSNTIWLLPSTLLSGFAQTSLTSEEEETTSCATCTWLNYSTGRKKRTCDNNNTWQQR